MSTNAITIFSIGGGNPSTLQPGVKPDEETCVANISPSERRKRLIAGIVQFFVSLAILVLLIRLGVDLWWRVGLFLPFFGAAVGFFQSRDKT